jgi:RNA polymerase sigma factor (sigma-70 family)
MNTTLSPSVRPDVLTDEQLLRRVAQRRDADALGQLYLRHRTGLLALAHRLIGDWHAAEDLVQDALVTVWGRAARFEGRSTVRSWLYGVVRYHALNRRRQRPLPLADTATDLDEVASDEHGPEALSLAAVTRDQLAAAMERLPEHHREIITLAFVAELTQPEIAEVLGVPVGTVKSRLHRARRDLAHFIIDNSTEVTR